MVYDIHDQYQAIYRPISGDICDATTRYKVQYADLLSDNVPYIFWTYFSKVMFCRVCGFRVRVWESYRTGVSQNFQKFRVRVWVLRHGFKELTEVPGGYEK